MEKLLKNLDDKKKSMILSSSNINKIDIINFDKTEKEKLLNYIKENLETKNFKKKIFLLLKKEIQKDISLEDPYHYFKGLAKNMNSISDKDLNEDNLMIEYIADFLYNDYSNRIKSDLKYAKYINLIGQNTHELEKNYKYINEDNQYKKYKLIKLNEYRKLYEHCSSKDFPLFFIEDIRLKIYIQIQDLQIETFKKLVYLKNKNYIKELAFRPFFFKPITEIPLQPGLEHFEFGKKFSFENLKQKVLPTKLYSSEGDSLWINIDKENITFEEISNNFEIVNDDTIVTQVLHCEYFLENNNFFIKHIDHEYIFYSLDEFEKRQNNIKQKGSKCQRVKTFKIDNSKIPFILNDKNILLFFLNQYFESKELLLEYFNKMES